MEINTNKYVGNKIREFREKRNLTQEEIAEFLNTTSQSISRYEYGDRKTGNDILFKLAEYFNVSVNDFFPPLKNTANLSKFHHTDEESGLSVEIIPTDNIDWNSLSKQEQEQYINQAMDTLYEAKKEIKNNK